MEKFDLLLPEDEKIFTYTRTDEHTKDAGMCKTLRMRKLAVHCLMSGKMGKSGFGIMRMTEKEMYCVHMRR